MMQELNVFICQKNKLRNASVYLRVILILCLLNAFFFFIAFIRNVNYKDKLNNNHGKALSIWPKFQSKLADKKLVSRICFSKVPNTLEDLIVILHDLNNSANYLCKMFVESFSVIFDVKERYSETVKFPLELSIILQKSLKEHYDEMNRQRIIHISNQFTYEQNAYNQLRSKRPRPERNESSLEFLNKLLLQSKFGCDFCNYLQMTAVDQLGRNTNDQTFRATNIFKIDKWHGMIITQSHNPTNLTIMNVKSLFIDGMKWANEVHNIDPNYIFPNFAWDILYKAGASQIHPHIHVMMTPDFYYGSMEQLRVAANSYFENNGYNYFTKLVDIYTELNLAVYYGSVVALSMLTGKGEMEVMILGDEPGPDLFSLLYFVIKAYQDHFTQYCISASLISSAMGKSFKAQQGKVPAIIRIISRGDCSSLQNDISSFNLFLMTFRVHDPYEVARAIRKSIRTYGA